LARRLNLDSLIRLEFTSPLFLYRLKEFHNDLFLVFEHYANKMQRDLPLSLTQQYSAEILYLSGLTDTNNDIALVRRLVGSAKSSVIVGRNSDVFPGVPPISPDELTFAELMEVCLRAGLQRYKGETIPAGRGGESGTTHTTTSSMLQGLKDASEVLKNPKPRKPPSPRQGYRDRDRDRERK
jgi:hypothetical protein